MGPRQIERRGSGTSSAGYVQSYLFLITLAIIESETPGREHLADCVKDIPVYHEYIYMFIPIESEAPGR
jgi:hypothetical protein